MTTWSLAREYRTISIGNASHKQCPASRLSPTANQGFPARPAGRPLSSCSVRWAVSLEFAGPPARRSQEFLAASSRANWREVAHGGLRDVRPDRARGTGHSDRTSILSPGVRSRGSDLRSDRECRKSDEEAWDIWSRGAIQRSTGEAADGCWLGALAAAAESGD